MGDNVTFQSLCRICSNKTNGFAIYSEEGKLHRLEEKIRRFLSITVSEDDSLPKMVCTLCFKKLDSIYRFAEFAADTQVKLINRRKFLSDSNNHRYKDDGSIASPIRDDDDVSTESASEKEDEDPQRSLLHSILTKGQESGSNDQVTELEVKIDPMLFLCDQDDEGDDEEGPEDHDDRDDRVSSPSPTSPSSVDNSSIYSDADTSYSAHSDHKPYQCNICPRGFNSDLSLRNHLWNHLPSSRKVLVSSDLNTHQTETSSQKQKELPTPTEWLCQICGRVYPSKSTLRAHQITHSNVRPHKCSLCEKTFKRNQDLKFHINQHTGARPYRCPYCPKAFASSGNCFSHRKRMHPKQIAGDKTKILSSRH